MANTKKKLAKPKKLRQGKKMGSVKPLNEFVINKVSDKSSPELLR